MRSRFGKKSFRQRSRRFRRLSGVFSPDQLSSLKAWYRADRVTAETLITDTFPGVTLDAAWTDPDSVTVSGGFVDGPNATDHIHRAGVHSGHISGLFESTATADSGLIFRVADTTNYLMARYSGAADAVQVYKNTAGSFVLLKQVAVSEPAGNWTVEVVFWGDEIRVWLDGVLALEHTLSGADYAAFAGTDVGYRIRASNDVGAFTLRTVDPATDLQWSADTFVQADTALNGETTPVGEQTWVSSTLDIVGNEVIPITTNVNSRAYVDIGEQDIDISVGFNVGAMSSSADRVGITYRHIGPTFTFNAWYSGDGNVVLNKYNTTSSDVVTVAVTSLTAGTDHTIRVIVIGSEHKVFLDGVLVITYTDSFNSTVTNHGLFLRGDRTADGSITSVSMSTPPFVPVWPDISGNGYHATALLEDSMILIPNSNGIVAVTGDGTATDMTSSLTLTQPNVIAVHGAITADNDFYFDGVGSVTRNVIYKKADGFTPYAGAELTPASDVSTAQAIVALYNGATSTMRVAGVETDGDLGTNDLSAGMRIGAAWNGTGPMDGFITELIAWDTGHADQLATIETYLNGG